MVISHWEHTITLINHDKHINFLEAVDEIMLESYVTILRYIGTNPLKPSFLCTLHIAAPHTKRSSPKESLQPGDSNQKTAASLRHLKGDKNKNIPCLLERTTLW